MKYFNIALRNVIRHKKRSIVTISTVCLGFVALGVIGGMVNNIFSNIKEQAITTERLGHLTFAKEGFFKNGKISPEDYLWTEDELNSIMKILESDEEVEVASPRLSLFGIASNGKSSTIFITEAIAPEHESILLKTNIDGRVDRDVISLNPGKEERSNVAIGSELSENLNLKQGDYLTLLTSTKDGIANAVDVDITEVYNTGNPGTNDKFVLSNFYMAQELYDTKGAERIIVTTTNMDDLANINSKLNSKLNQAGYKVESKTWEELSVSYGKVKTMFGVIFRVLTMIISVIVLLTLLNTMQMAVTERTKEIGTIRALGVLKRNIIKMFCFEGVILGLIGCLLAIPVLLIISTVLKAMNVTFIPPIASTEVPITIILKPQNIIPVFILFFIASVVSSLIAARKIANQDVIKSLAQSN